MKKKILVVFLIIAFAAGAAGTYFLYREAKYSKESVPESIDLTRFESLKSSSQQATSALTGEPFPSAIPLELNFQMTFYSQAPFANWDEPWQEACEEASILLVANTYFDHNWSREQFNDQILKLVDWENKNFGDYRNTNVVQIVQMLHDYLGLEAVIHKDPTFEDIQKVLAKGHLIVMTFAGKQIGNPYYKNGGPEYHAMVIKGYKQGEKVITEDVGTKNGENYVYPWATLQRALHDFTRPIENGEKVMIEVLPPTLKTRPVGSTREMNAPQN